MSDLITPQRIAEVDAKYPSTKQRAEEIWAIFQIAHKELDMEMSEYDITCFAVQWLGNLAIGRFDNNQKFVELAKEFNRWLNSVHYTEAESIFNGLQPEPKDSPSDADVPGDTPES